MAPGVTAGNHRQHSVGDSHDAPSSAKKVGGSTKTSSRPASSSSSRARSVINSNPQMGSGGQNRLQDQNIRHNSERLDDLGSPAESIDDQALKLENLIDHSAANHEAKEQASWIPPVNIDVWQRAFSLMGSCPFGLRHVYQKLSLPNEGLSSIAFLSHFQYLHILELPGNYLEDVSPLAQMCYLTRLDLSNNRLTSKAATIRNLDDPVSPAIHNLQELDLSRNLIDGDLADVLGVHRFLRRACVDGNAIQDVKGVGQRCAYLTHFSARQNEIGSLEGLEGLPLKVLDMRHNMISSLCGVETMDDLQELYISYNLVESLSPLFGTEKNMEARTPTNPYHIRVLDIANNNLSSTYDLTALSSSSESLPLLTDLNLQSNPISSCPSLIPAPDAYTHLQYTPLSTTIESWYRYYVVYLLPRLRVLDGRPVSVEDKVAARHLYDPPGEVVAGVAHAVMVARRSKMYARIQGSVVGPKKAERLRPLVLCGPNGVGKRTLTAKLLREFPEVFGLCVSHTTRKPRPSEEDGVNYHFVGRDEMDALVQAGALLEVVTFFGNMYGTSLESVERVAEDGKVCILDLEIEGMWALKRSHVNPRYVFIAAPSIEALQMRLQHKYSVHSSRAYQERRKSVDAGESSGPEVEDESVLDAAEFIKAVSKWVEKAREWFSSNGTLEDLEDGVFDLTIVNDDLEEAYIKLKDWCKKMYWSKDGDTEDESEEEYDDD
ncbi:hypothetical protein BJ742DRAFT_807665 [Cladochytrium replicatum]|nr:hypothetical protein BJ742DRAFT_807665 [Cladochytrium replicatum]